MLNRVKKLQAVGLGLGLILTQISTVFADDINIQQPTQVSVSQVGQLISAGVGIAILIAGLLAFLYLVWGGIEWITSGGDKAGLEAAKNRITNALVGLVIVIAAWAIVKLIETFFHITILGGFSIPKVTDFPTQ